MEVDLPKNVVEFYNTTKENLEKLISLQEKDSEKHIEKTMELDELKMKFKEQQDTINSIAKEAQQTSGMTDLEIVNLFKRYTNGDMTEKELLNQVTEKAEDKSRGHMYS